MRWRDGFVSVRYITLANILLDRRAVPEFIQERCTGRLAGAAAAAACRTKGPRAPETAISPKPSRSLVLGGEPPSIRAARALLDFVRRPDADAQRRPIGT